MERCVGPRQTDKFSQRTSLISRSWSISLPRHEVHEVSLTNMLHRLTNPFIGYLVCRVISAANDYKYV
jgi:hypothetical protein